MEQNHNKKFLRVDNMYKYVCMKQERCDEHCTFCKTCTLFSICSPRCEERNQCKDEEACSTCQFAKLVEEYEKEREGQAIKDKKIVEEFKKRNKPKSFNEIRSCSFRRTR